jgi:hypothetical protein
LLITLISSTDIIFKIFNRKKKEREETEEIALKALKIASQEISEGIRKVHKDTLDTIYYNNSQVSKIINIKI